MALHITPNIGLRYLDIGDDDWADELQFSLDRLDAVIGKFDLVGNYNATSRPNLSKMIGEEAGITTSVIQAILTDRGDIAVNTADIAALQSAVTPAGLNAFDSNAVKLSSALTLSQAINFIDALYYETLNPSGSVVVKTGPDLLPSVLLVSAGAGTPVGTGYLRWHSQPNRLSLGVQFSGQLAEGNEVNIAAGTSPASYTLYGNFGVGSLVVNIPNPNVLRAIISDVEQTFSMSSATVFLSKNVLQYQGEYCAAVFDPNSSQWHFAFNPSGAYAFPNLTVVNDDPTPGPGHASVSTDLPAGFGNNSEVYYVNTDGQDTTAEAFMGFFKSLMAQDALFATGTLKSDGSVFSNLQTCVLNAVNLIDTDGVTAGPFTLKRQASIAAVDVALNFGPSAVTGKHLKWFGTAVTPYFELNDKFNVIGDLDATGDLTVGGDAGVTGAISGASLQVNGAIGSATGNLTLTLGNVVLLQPGATVDGYDLDMFDSRIGTLEGKSHTQNTDYGTTQDTFIIGYIPPLGPPGANVEQKIVANTGSTIADVLNPGNFIDPKIRWHPTGPMSGAWQINNNGTWLDIGAGAPGSVTGVLATAPLAVDNVMPQTPEVYIDATLGTVGQVMTITPGPQASWQNNAALSLGLDDVLANDEHGGGQNIFFINNIGEPVATGDGPIANLYATTVHASNYTGLSPILMSTVNPADTITIQPGGGVGTMLILGNLTVTGTTTWVNTQNLDVKDKNITVNKGGLSGASNGAGITVDRTDTPGFLPKILWNQTTGKWQLDDGSGGPVQDIATGASLGSYLPLAGGTMTGSIILGNHTLYGGALTGQSLDLRANFADTYSHLNLGVNIQASFTTGGAFIVNEMASQVMSLALVTSSFSTSASTLTGFTFNANSVTSGTAMSLSANALSGGVALSVKKNATKLLEVSDTTVTTANILAFTDGSVEVYRSTNDLMFKDPNTNGGTAVTLSSLYGGSNPPLSAVLGAGNSAGSNPINMNSQIIFGNSGGGGSMIVANDFTDFAGGAGTTWTGGNFGTNEVNLKLVNPAGDADVFLHTNEFKLEFASVPKFIVDSLGNIVVGAHAGSTLGYEQFLPLLAPPGLDTFKFSGEALRLDYPAAACPTPTLFTTNRLGTPVGGFIIFPNSSSPEGSAAILAGDGGVGNRTVSLELGKNNGVGPGNISYHLDHVYVCNKTTSFGYQDINIQTDPAQAASVTLTLPVQNGALVAATGTPTNGQVPTFNAGTVAWATPGGGGGSLSATLAIGNTTGNHNIVLSSATNDAIVSDAVGSGVFKYGTVSPGVLPVPAWHVDGVGFVVTDSTMSYQFNPAMVTLPQGPTTNVGQIVIIPQDFDGFTGPPPAYIVLSRDTSGPTLQTASMGLGGICKAATQGWRSDLHIYDDLNQKVFGVRGEAAGSFVTIGEDVNTPLEFGSGSNVKIYRDTNDLKFQDVTGGPYTLAQLAAGGGGDFTRATATGKVVGDSPVVVDSFADTVPETGAVWHYTIQKTAGTGSPGFVAGTVTAVWDASSDVVQYTNVQTSAIGGVTGIAVSVADNANVIQFIATISEGTWNIRTARVMI